MAVAVVSAWVFMVAYGSEKSVVFLTEASGKVKVDDKF
jgi:hypothetical protein